MLREGRQTPQEILVHPEPKMHIVDVSVTEKRTGVLLDRESTRALLSRDYNDVIAEMTQARDKREQTLAEMKAWDEPIELMLSVPIVSRLQKSEVTIHPAMIPDHFVVQPQKGAEKYFNGAVQGERGLARADTAVQLGPGKKRRLHIDCEDIVGRLKQVFGEEFLGDKASAEELANALFGHEMRYVIAEVGEIQFLIRIGERLCQSRFDLDNGRFKKGRTKDTWELQKGNDIRVDWKGGISSDPTFQARIHFEAVKEGLPSFDPEEQKVMQAFAEGVKEAFTQTASQQG